jgi:hypothetical protein
MIVPEDGNAKRAVAAARKAIAAKNARDSGRPSAAGKAPEFNIRVDPDLERECVVLALQMGDEQWASKPLTAKDATKLGIILIQQAFNLVQQLAKKATPPIALVDPKGPKGRGIR